MGGTPIPIRRKAATDNYVTVTVQCNFTLITLGSDGDSVVRQFDDLDPIGLDADAGECGRTVTRAGRGGGGFDTVSHSEDDLVHDSGKRAFGDRRGMTALEVRLVYPLTLLMLMGTIIIGLGVFRYPAAPGPGAGRGAVCLGPRPVLQGGDRQCPRHPRRASRPTSRAWPSASTASMHERVLFGHPDLPCTVTVGTQLHVEARRRSFRPRVDTDVDDAVTY